MRRRRIQLIKLGAVGLAVSLFTASMIFKTSPKGEAAPAGAVQTETDPPANPPGPRVESMEAEPLATKTAEGDALLRVRFAREEGVGPEVKTVIDDRDVILRDDGTGGDESAGDGTHSAIISLDFEALAANQDRVTQLNNAPQPAPTATIDPTGTDSASAAQSDDGADSATAGTTATTAPDEDLSSSTSVKMPDFEEGRDWQGTKSVAKVDFRAAAPGKPVPLFPIGTPKAVDPARSLFITDIRVVEDPTRTFNPCNGVGTPMGAWTFGRLMKEMANQPRTGINPSTFVRRWLDKWMADQTTANGWTAEKRQQIKSLIIDPWEAASGGPGAPLNLSIAPFRLLAIVNRVDLRSNSSYGGGNAGEGRFVFSVIDRRPTSRGGTYPGGGGNGCGVTQFTVIIEYGIDRRGCGIRDWGRQWYNLRNFTLGSPAYNAALQAITDQFTLANKAPHKPNGSALNQLRTNEIAIANPPPDDTWQLREFRLPKGDGHLFEANVALTPDESLRNTDLTAQWVNANAAAVINETHVVPLFFMGQKFLGNESNVPLSPGPKPPPFNTFWSDGPNVGIFPRQARHKFSVNTCSGCHAGETETVFTHVKPAAFGTPAPLSGFITGITVADPADGFPSRTFNELSRRAIDLDILVHSPCFFDIRRHFIPQVH
jgi:hypothetical protein